jgi:hypothetical protein
MIGFDAADGLLAVRLRRLVAGTLDLRACEAMLAVGLFASALTVPQAQAGPADPSIEIFTGLEATDNAVSGYLGFGYAFGKGLYESGWRVRAVGSLGAYDYQGTLFGRGSDLATTFDGQSTFGAAMLGYQFRANSLFLKLFAGIEGEDQNISPRDPNNSVQGSAVGARFVAETWYEVSPLWFASLDASYGTAFQQYWSRARLGYRLRPRLALGIEGGALGNEEYDAGRGGGFAKLNIRGLEVTLAGGFSGNYLEDEPSGYVSLGVYRAF